MKNVEVRRRLRRLQNDVEKHGVVGSILMRQLIKNNFPSNAIGELD